MKRVHSKEVEKAARDLLVERGVTVMDIAEIAYEMQKPYSDNLTIETCIENVNAVLKKREIQHAILVGIELDKLAEKGLLSEPLLSLIRNDEGLFGVDETIAFGASLGYGSVSFTTYGFLDKNKIGIIKELDTKSGKAVHTFLDDLVASIAATASARIAHRERDIEEGLIE